jgi:hypothetical protein
MGREGWEKRRRDAGATGNFLSLSTVDCRLSTVNFLLFRVP